MKVVLHGSTAHPDHFRESVPDDVIVERTSGASSGDFIRLRTRDAIIWVNGYELWEICAMLMQDERYITPGHECPS